MKQVLSADQALDEIQKRFLALLEAGDSFQIEINYKDGQVVMKSTDYVRLSLSQKPPEGRRS